MAALAAAAHAQCLGAATGSVQTLTPTGGFAASDEGRTVPAVALGFNFPMAGALPLSSPPGIATHAFVESNGELYLTNSFYGVFAPLDPSLYGVTSLSELRGLANASPRICPWGGDSEAGNGGNWGIYVDTSIPNQATFYWQDVWPYSGGVPTGSCSFSCTLYASGDIDFSYGALGSFTATPFNIVGVSIGNGVGNGTEVSQDLSAGPDSGSLGMLYEEFFAGPHDLENRTIRFSPNGIGGFTTSLVCTGAYHQEYGQGCYGPEAKQAIYQYFGQPADAITALNGQSMKAIPTVNGYLFIWGGGTYVAPTGGATVLLQGDDTELDVTPSIPFPHVSGAIPTLSVASNGYVNMAPIGTNWPASYAEVFDLLNDPAPAFRTNIDWNFNTGGTCTAEEIAGVLYITWDQATRYNGSGTDTVQLQFDLNTGEVTYVWQSLASTSTSGTALGSLIGYAPGVSLDPGSIDLAIALPQMTSPDVTLSPLSLSASPPPVMAGPTGPTVNAITWTVDNVPDAAPPFGIGVGFVIFSVAPFPGGLDMGIVGMPGCNLNLLSLDVIIGLPGAVPTDSVSFVVPAPLSPGLSFYAQALCIFPPNSLPNGQNSFGGLLSNGVQSYFNIY